MNPPILHALREVAGDRRGALVRFLYERSNTEADADDILALLDVLEEAERALGPFAVQAADYDNNDPDTILTHEDQHRAAWIQGTVGDLRQARAALSRIKDLSHG